jgi:hypothetical protein
MAPSTSIEPGRAAHGPRRPWRALAIAVLAAIALVGTFTAYLRPDMAFTLANQLWSCF